MDHYWLISHHRPRRLATRNMRPFRLINRAQLPGLDDGDDVWARANLRLLVSESAVDSLTSVWNGPGCVGPPEFEALREKVLEILPDISADCIEPGVRFGPPRLKVAGAIWFDLFHEICTAKFQRVLSDADLSGLKFHEVEVAGVKRGELLCLEAAFSTLSDSDPEVACDFKCQALVET